MQRKSSIPVKPQIDGKLRTKLDAILACGAASSTNFLGNERSFLPSLGNKLVY
jgi:hypothetical protein